MTDTDIIELAKLRFEQLKRDVGLSFGDFDVFISHEQTAKVVIHNGSIKHIEVPYKDLGCRKKITL